MKQAIYATEIEESDRPLRLQQAREVVAHWRVSESLIGLRCPI
jgi:hypothetical protein